MASTNDRPRIPIPWGPWDLALQAAAFGVVIGGFVFAWRAIGTLPDQIPTHFDLQGKADGWGPRGTLWMLPGASCALFVLLAGVSRLPVWYWNLPVRVTPENAARVYASARRMLLVLTLLCTLLFLLLLVEVVGAARSGQGSIWATLVCTPVILGTVLGWVVRLHALGKSRRGGVGGA